MLGRFVLVFVCFIFSTNCVVSSNKPVKTVYQSAENTRDSICVACELESMLSFIEQRIKAYGRDTSMVYKLYNAGGDTLIEIIEFHGDGMVEYHGYQNNLLKIRYSGMNSSGKDCMLTLMNENEMELKRWLVKPGELHVTDYDAQSRMERYFASILKGKDSKIEYLKEWNPESGSFVSGQTETFEKDEKGNWQWLSTTEIGANDWP